LLFREAKLQKIFDMLTTPIIILFSDVQIFLYRSFTKGTFKNKVKVNIMKKEYETAYFV